MDTSLLRPSCSRLRPRSKREDRSLCRPEAMASVGKSAGVLKSLACRNRGERRWRTREAPGAPGRGETTTPSVLGHEKPMSPETAWARLHGQGENRYSAIEFIEDRPEAARATDDLQLARHPWRALAFQAACQPRRWSSAMFVL